MQDVPAFQREFPTVSHDFLKKPPPFRKGSYLYLTFFRKLHIIVSAIFYLFFTFFYQEMIS